MALGIKSTNSVEIGDIIQVDNLSSFRLYSAPEFRANSAFNNDFELGVVTQVGLNPYDTNQPEIGYWMGLRNDNGLISYLPYSNEDFVGNNPFLTIVVNPFHNYPNAPTSAVGQGNNGGFGDFIRDLFGIGRNQNSSPVPDDNFNIDDRANINTSPSNPTNWLKDNAIILLIIGLLVTAFVLFFGGNKKTNNKVQSQKIVPPKNPNISVPIKPKPTVRSRRRAKPKTKTIITEYA